MSQNGKSGFRPYLGPTFLIGFGFFTMGLTDPLYDTYVPIFLGRYISSMGVVGLVMTLDNLFALFLIPLVAVWSDKTRTPIGRRMPFILVTLPLMAVSFGLLPYAAEVSLAALVAAVFLLNVWKQAARGPVVALMPDTVPGELRSEANGVINTMGGIASIVGTIGLARLMDLDIVLPVLGPTKGRLPFPLAGVLVVGAAMLLAAFVRERESADTAVEQKVSLGKSIAAIAGNSDRSALRILVSLFLWFLGYQGVLPFIGKYSVEVLGVSQGLAAFGAGMVGIAYALFAVPSGYIAHRIGRRRAIRISLAVLAFLVSLLFFLDPMTRALGFSGMSKVYLFWAILFFFGIFWVTVVTNSFPMLWQMSEYGNVGIYTGLYYTFSQSAAILAPPLTGAIIDLAGYRGIFAFCAAAMAAAFFVMGKVRSGEPAPSA
ncbi:MAG TPA: MFS transporter [Magnetospirillaceae bacterium]|nr:MFS transporter [Magnetospirillaceae bacterium]